ncbi:hypothetical protein HLB44_10575 [Aquincola sp. S2]|uniref:Uncharacterized protein n=2 Tax=Pseudaquabacterium terrae TaxID=2732868 RepID=A0ABX2EFN8_9BURK|nr:hypothetical protein [Aquabacterium terrae]
MAWLCAGATAAASASEPLFLDLQQQGATTSRTLTAHLLPAQADLGRPISLFVAALLPGGAWVVLSPAGWLPLGAEPPAWQHAQPAAFSHSVALVDAADVGGLLGTRVFAGYGHATGTVAAAWAEMLAAGRYREIGTLRAAPTLGLNAPASAPACPADAGAPLFGTAPIDPVDFIAMRPLGFQSNPIHVFPAKHGAFSMTPLGATPQARPVRAPARASVREMIQVRIASGGGNYQVFMHPCREVRLYFGHLATVSTRLQAAFDAGTPRCSAISGELTTCRRDDLDLALDEGEVFGHGPDTAGVDFGLVDARRPAAGFIYPEHYDAYYPFWQAPLDYFNSAVRAALAAKTGSVLGALRRTAEPLGGSHAVDLAGTAQGNWFVPGRYWIDSGGDSAGLLALGSDYVDPAQPLLAHGGAVSGLAAGLMAYTPRDSGAVNRRFADISGGGTFCLEGFLGGRSPGEMPLSAPSGALMLKLLNPVALRVEWVPGSDCSVLAGWAFSTKAAVFVR